MLYNCLGLPIAMAVLGKNNNSSPQTEADDLNGINPEDNNDISNQNTFWNKIDNSDPSLLVDAAQLLLNASWRCVVDYSMTGGALRVAMIAREEHFVVNQNSNLLLRITYTDGLGRVAMHKILAEPI
jgi:hypothetical protein